MGFIKAQKVVRDENGNIVSGSASIVDTIYCNYGSYHSKQQVRERLGKVIYLSKDKKSGIFLSPTRGLVQYEAASDTFSPVMSMMPVFRTPQEAMSRKSIPYLGTRTCSLNFCKNVA